jgi:hypothetical protein
VLIIGFLVPGVTYAMRKPSWKTMAVVEEEAGPAAAAAAATATDLGVAQTPAMAQGGADADEATTQRATEPPSPDDPGYDPERHPTGDHPTRRKLIYGAVGVVVGAALVYGLVVLPDRRKDEEAQAKADEVIALMEEQGLTPPSKDLLVNLLGVDGGNVCVDPASALNEAMHRISLANGAAHVGVRPVIVDSAIVQGELAILDVYCPDKAEQARNYLEGLKYDDVVHQ